MEFVSTTLTIFDCFIGEYRDWLIVEEAESPDKQGPTEVNYDLPKDFDELIRNFVAFAAIWGFGATTDEKTRPQFIQFFDSLIQGEDVRENYVLPDIPEDWVPTPQSYKFPGSIFECVYNKRKDGQYYWMLWMNLMEGVYSPPKESQFYELIIPTTETESIRYILRFI